MYNIVSSTELQNNTKGVIRQVLSKPQVPTVIYNYKEPQVVIVSYERWLKQGNTSVKHKKTPLSELEKYFGSSPKPVDSTKLIRKWRDAE